MRLQLYFACRSSGVIGKTGVRTHVLMIGVNNLLAIVGQNEFGKLNRKAGDDESAADPVAVVKAVQYAVDLIHEAHSASLHLGNGNGKSGTSTTGNGSGNLASDAVSAALAYRAQAPVLDGLMKELGLDGSSLDNLVKGPAAAETSLRLAEVQDEPAEEATKPQGKAKPEKASAKDDAEVE